MAGIFFPYILEIQIISSLAETLLMGKSVNGWTLGIGTMKAEKRRGY